MRRVLLALLLLTGLAGAAAAVEPSERLADSALEARARQISKGLRCLVCQNESIDESQADLAHDVRVMLRERLMAGDTDAQAVQYIVARYGAFVLLQPPVSPATYALWFGPPALLLAGIAVLVLAARRRPPATPEPLNAEERERLAQVLNEGEP